MGYDLHITRKTHWSDKGNDISSEEWLAIVKNDPELKIESENGPFFAIWTGPTATKSSWLNWSNGQISTKNPDDTLITKMVTIAQELSAVVQGDDGEIYHSAKDAHGPSSADRIPTSLYLYRRFVIWIGKWFVKPKSPAPPFKVGDLVISLTTGKRGTVRAINRRDYYGYGTVRVKYDDGIELTSMLNAHGLSLATGRGETTHTPQQKTTKSDDTHH